MYLHSALGRYMLRSQWPCTGDDSFVEITWTPKMGLKQNFALNGSLVHAQRALPFHYHWKPRNQLAISILFTFVKEYWPPLLLTVKPKNNLAQIRYLETQQPLALTHLLQTSRNSEFAWIINIIQEGHNWSFWRPEATQVNCFYSPDSQIIPPTSPPSSPYKGPCTRENSTPFLSHFNSFLGRKQKKTHIVTVNKVIGDLQN